MRGIESCKASQFFGVHLIAFAIAVRDRTELADVRHDDFMPKFSKLLTDPDRVSARFPSRYAPARDRENVGPGQTPWSEIALDPQPRPLHSACSSGSRYPQDRPDRRSNLEAPLRNFRDEM